MVLLYITEDYFASKVHNNLLIEELKQDPSLIVYVFCPRRGIARKDLSSTFSTSSRLIVLSPLISIKPFVYKYDFFAKIREKVSLINKCLDIRKINAIHAATLYSDGAVAYSLSKKYKIPYCISIRGTDAKTYSNHLFYLWPLANRIIKHSSSVSFLTQAIKDRFDSFWQYWLVRDELHDGQIINNGIDSIWIQNIRNVIPSLHQVIRVLFIGRFDSNKNVESLIKAVISLRDRYPIHLTLIGGKGGRHSEILGMINENAETVEYLGEIYDKEKLLMEVRKCNIFAMPSHGETFGLVYAECLSQGLPLLYSLNTGFDGMFPQGYIGYGVDSHSIEAISEGLVSIITNFELLKKNIVSLDFSLFSWDKIASRYLSIYNNLVG